MSIHASDVVYAMWLLKCWHAALIMKGKVENSQQISVTVWNQDGSGNFPMIAPSYTGPPNDEMRRFCLHPIIDEISAIEVELSEIGVVFSAEDKTLRYQIAIGEPTIDWRRYKELRDRFGLRRWAEKSTNEGGN